MSDTAIEYFVFVFIAAISMIQLAAARAQLFGLLLFRRRVTAYVFSILSIAASFLWFFGVSDRNVPGLEGSQQFEDFVFATLSAILFTLLASSGLRRGAKAVSKGTFLVNGEGQERLEGLEALKRLSYIEAVILSLRKNNLKADAVR